MAATQLSGVIKANQTTSGIYNLPGDQILVNVILPANFTGTTITFQASRDGRTFYNVYDDADTQLSATVASSRFVTGLLKLAGIRYLKIVAGTAQTQDTTIYLDVA